MEIASLKNATLESKICGSTTFIWISSSSCFSKVLEDCPSDLSFWYCHISKGAWPFSTRDHGWPISDYTAEGLKEYLSNPVQVKVGKVSSPTANVSQILEKVTESEKVSLSGNLCEK
ncbi:cucurbitadienol synthase-like [Magnolia sinica]|uniref:cucurbitadienol synthase-like n=1 Tax=Magnolia sinica TaxID=86752 RepID=UPI00265AD9C1|nr:cucurbitadienol synthase-like [Magnolia sinica]